MNQVNRLKGGQIDRSVTHRFKFDGKTFEGHQGDTLASALLANGVRLMGRSFKYHRPRGVLTAGSEEPNALVELRNGARQEPNSRATTIELFDGLLAKSQNRLGPLKYDLLAINDRFSNFLTAGFYYKTFMWPAAFWEKVYEPIIRRAAGLGSLSQLDDPDVYDKGFLYCDLLVIGAGPAGLAAALTAGRSGAEVILADEDFRMGGRLNCESLTLDDQSAPAWADDVVAELKSLPNVRVMHRTTIIGAFDHGIYGAVERISDHLIVPDLGKPRQILWRIYTKRTILATGAIERPIAFENNDRPGIMLASAIRTYANRFAVAANKKIVIFTNNDDGHRTAKDLHAMGVEVCGVIDVRADAPRSLDYEVLHGQVVDTKGRLGLNQVKIRLENGNIRSLDCGALGVSGGWNPNVHLTCHQRGRPTWRDDIAAFVPGVDLPLGMSVAGAASGIMSTTGALQSGTDAACAALSAIGIKSRAITIPQTEDAPVSIQPFWYVKGCRRAWIDLQNDVTVKDIQLSHQEGFRAVEHLKRYTTL